MNKQYSIFCASIIIASMPALAMDRAQMVKEWAPTAAKGVVVLSALYGAHSAINGAFERSSGMSKARDTIIGFAEMAAKDEAGQEAWKKVNHVQKLLRASKALRDKDLVIVPKAYLALADAALTSGQEYYEHEGKAERDSFNAKSSTLQAQTIADSLKNRKVAIYSALSPEALNLSGTGRAAAYAPTPHERTNSLASSGTGGKSVKTRRKASGNNRPSVQFSLDDSAHEPAPHHSGSSSSSSSSSASSGSTASALGSSISAQIPSHV